MLARSWSRAGGEHTTNGPHQSRRGAGQGANNGAGGHAVPHSGRISRAGAPATQLDGKSRRFSNSSVWEQLRDPLAGPDLRGCSHRLLTERLVGGKVADSLEAVLRCPHGSRGAAHALADVLAAPATAGNSKRPEAAGLTALIASLLESHAGRLSPTSVWSGQGSAEAQQCEDSMRPNTCCKEQA
jgi:hypothetical protein